MRSDTYHAALALRFNHAVPERSDRPRNRAGGGASDRGLDIEIGGLLFLLATLGLAYLALQVLEGAALFFAAVVLAAMGGAALGRIDVGKRWQRGGAGEVTVGRALRELEDRGWLVEHDVMKPSGGNIDHVVAGSGGVFAVETKLNTFGQSGLRQARSHAAYLRKRLAVAVTPVICVVRTKADPKEYAGVWVVSPTQLVPHLEAGKGPPAPTTPVFVEAFRGLRDAQAPEPDSPRAEPRPGVSGRWIRARYPGRCRRCNRSVEPGDRVLHDRVRRAIWCADCAR